MVQSIGEMSIWKPGSKTASETVTDALTFPEVPVMVTGTASAVLLTTAAESLAISVSWLLPVVGFALQYEVTPLGRPETDRFTLPANSS